MQLLVYCLVPAFLSSLGQQGSSSVFFASASSVLEMVSGMLLVLNKYLWNERMKE